MEQQRIVAAIETQFSRLDEAVANLKRVKANLKRYKAAVLKSAVEGKLTEDWRKQHPDVEPAEKLLERILAERRKAVGKGKYKEPVAADTSGLPELPAGWVWVSLDQIVECLDSKRVPINKKERASRQGNVPYYGANGQVGWIDDYLFNEPLVLVVEDETFTGRELPFCYKISGKAWVNNHAHVLRCTRAVEIDYLNHALSYYPFTPLTTGTTGRKKLTQAALLGAVFKLPPLVEQHQIVAEVERRLSIVAEAEAQVDSNLRRADRLRQSILKQAFSGQLVPQDPNDEPASVLLQRIRNAVGANNHSPRTAPKTSKRANVDSPLQRQNPRQPAESKPATGFTCLDDITSALLAAMQPGREYARADLVDPLGLSTGQWNAAIQELKRTGKVRQTGEKRGARYVLSVRTIESSY